MVGEDSSKQTVDGVNRCLNLELVDGSPGRGVEAWNGGQSYALTGLAAGRRPRLTWLAGVGPREAAVIQLVDREARACELGLEASEHVFRVGAKPVVAENHRAVVGEIKRRLVVAAPQGRSRNRGWIDPIDGCLECRKEPNRVEPQQALDGPRVVAEGQHEQRVRKDFGQLAADEHVARKGVTERAVAGAFGSPADELRGVELDLLDIPGSKRLPLRRSEALQPVSGPELDGKRAVREI